MIFYFSGTGNSYNAALQLADGDTLINIADCVTKKDYTFEIGEEMAQGVGASVPQCHIELCHSVI